MDARRANSTVHIPSMDASIRTYSCRDQNSGGLWVGDNPLDFRLPVMLLQLILIFFLSRTIYWLLRPFKQPKFVCNIMAGVILGPSVLGRNKKFSEHLFDSRAHHILNAMSVFGAVYFVFLIAVKMDASMIKRTSRSTWNIAIAGTFVPLLTVFSLLHSLKHKLPQLHHGYFLLSVACVLSFSFFAVIAHALDELNLMTSELGQLALSLATINDVSQLVLVAVFVVVRQPKMTSSIEALVATLAVVAFTVFVIRPAILMIVKRTPAGKPVKEIYIVAIFIGVAVMAVTSNIIGASMIHGAILLGLVIPDGPPLGSTLTEKAETFVSEVFLPFMFLHIGYETNVRSIKNWKAFFLLQFIILAGYCSRMMGTLTAALYSKIKMKDAVLLSLIMSIRGMIDILAYRKWLHFDLIDDQTYTQLVLSLTVLTMIVTPMIEVYYKPHPRLNRNPSTRQKRKRSIQELTNDNEFRILSCVHSQYNVPSIIAVLEGSNATEASPLSAYVIHLVELVGRSVPLLAQHSKHRSKSKDENSEHIMRAFENYSNNSGGSVTVHPFVLNAPYKSMHDCISSFSRDNLISFIIIPFHENQKIIAGKQKIASIRHLNASLQAYAPCTVGILVDRDLGGRLSSANFSYNIAVIFIGGVDDREALALAGRMSCHSEVSTTVLHIILPSNKKGLKDRERKADETVLDEFKLKNVRNPRVVVKEIMVEDGIKVFHSLVTIEKNYDLVMVGHRRGNALNIDEEMSDFIENTELGAIGDMLASSDICGGEVPVLVMHHGDDIDGECLSNRSDYSRSSLTVSELLSFNGR